ncbi:MAG: shikimate dehydrogenase family protein [Acetobacteraceae bacterium]
MLQRLNGATRLYPIVGDPIVQVQSPAGVSRGLLEHGVNGLCIPAHVAPADLAPFVEGLSRAENVDGLIVTVPHKFAAFRLCASASARAGRLQAVNVMRRNPDRTWHGEMLDGLAFVKAQQAAGRRLRGARALLVGAGGAGSAIALALIESGVRELVIHDQDPARLEALLHRLAGAAATVRSGSPDPTGFDLICNATPSGMRAGDPLPVAVANLTPAMSVGDVVTKPEATPLLIAARAKGCPTATGIDMFGFVQRLLIDFLLGH